MEKNNLILAAIGLIIILVFITLNIIGNWDTDPEVNDCGVNLECFNLSLVKGSKANVRYTEKIQIPPNNVCYGCQIYYTNKDTEAEIINCEEKFCEINLTNIKAVSDLIDVEDEIWENAKCYYKRNPVEETGAQQKRCEKIE